MLERKYPNKFFYGCVSHELNLLFEDIITDLFGKNGEFAEFKKIGDHANKIIKYFRNHHDLNKALRKLQSDADVMTLAKQGTTRWGSFHKSIVSLIANDPLLRQLVSDANFVTNGSDKDNKGERREIKEIILSEEWLERLDRCKRLLDPISTYIVTFQSDLVPVSQVFKMWLDLPKKYKQLLNEEVITQSQLDEVNELLKLRFSNNYNDGQGIAYVLDPRYLGKDMDCGTSRGVDNFIGGWRLEGKVDFTTDKSVTMQLIEFQDNVRDGWDRAKEVINGNLSPYKFWKSLHQDLYPELRDLALRVFSLVPSSAASERNFSTFKFIHSNLRNRLKQERVHKLVYVYANHRLGTKRKYEDEYESDSDDIKVV